MPGFSVAIVNENQVLYKKGFGFASLERKIPFTPSTIENLVSVSKTVLGLALIKVIENGNLSLDSKSNDFLPFKVINPYYPEIPVLLRHLANHTSGIPDTKHYSESYIYNDIINQEKDIDLNYLKFIKSHQKMPLEEFLSKILDKQGDWYKKQNFLKAESGSKK